MANTREPLLQPIPILSLHPTQMTVGMREVKEKRKRWREHNKKKEGKRLGSHMIPVVLGPGKRHYVIDHHLAGVISQSFGATENTFPNVGALLALRGAFENAARHGVTVLGASGGVFGLLLAFAWYFPKQRLMLLFPPIPMPAWLFVTLYGGIELVLGVTGAQPGVAHFAHLGGMLGGALAILYWRARGRFTA